MKQGRSLQDLAVELERQKKEKRDFVSAANRLRVQTVPGGPISMRLGEIGEFPMRQLAEEQLSRRTEIPFKYFSRMKDLAPSLLEENVNHWLQADKDSKVMVRTLDGKARAILSDRYRPLDNYDLAEAVLPALSEMEINVVSTEVTDNHLYIKAVTEKVSMQVSKGDVVQAGIVISNSEVGLGSLKVEPMVYRLICLNGMISADASMRKYHVGRGNDDGSDPREYFSNETKVADDKAFWLKCRDVVKGALKQALFEKLVNRMKEISGNKITGKPEDVIEVVQERYALSDDEKTGILSHLIKGNDLNQYALVNAVTRTSHDARDYDRATDLERIGGDILELKGKKVGFHGDSRKLKLAREFTMPIMGGIDKFLKWKIIMVGKLEKYEGIKMMVDKLAKKTFGIYLSAAVSRKICIECRKPAKKFKNRRNQSLYQIDGLCDNCRRKFDLK